MRNKRDFRLMRSSAATSPSDDQVTTKDEQLRYRSTEKIQLQAEIQQQLAEMTRYTHLKVLILGSLLVLAKGKMTLLILVIMPFAIHTLDIMHGLRFRHIFDRWRFLAEVIEKEIAALLGKKVETFADFVVRRHSMGDYERLNVRMRSLIFIPTLVLSSLSVGAIAVGAFKTSEHYAHVIAISWYGLAGWLLWRCPLSLYNKRVLAGAFVLLVGLAFVDRVWVSSSVFSKLIELTRIAMG